MSNPDSLTLKAVFEDAFLEDMFAQFLRKNLCDENYHFYKLVQLYKVEPETERRHLGQEVL